MILPLSISTGNHELVCQLRIRSSRCKRNNLVFDTHSPHVPLYISRTAKIGIITLMIPNI